MNTPDVPVPASARPVPPLAPELEDCCRSGCVPCVFDLYEESLARYQEALAAWEAAQPPGSPPCLPPPSG